MVDKLITKKGSYELRIEKIKAEKEEFLGYVDKLYKNIENIKLLFNPKFEIMYKSSEIEFDNDLRDINELTTLDSWVRKDHVIDIILNDVMAGDEIKIGEINVVLFNIKNFDNKGFTMDEFDEEADTFSLYESIFYCNEFPRGIVEDGIFDSSKKSYRRGILLYISHIELEEEYRNKGYGEYTLKYIEKIVENLFNVDVASLVIRAEPFRADYTGEKACYNHERFLDRLEYKESDMYYYKIFNFMGSDKPKTEFTFKEKVTMLENGKYMHGDLRHKKKIADELKQSIEESGNYAIEQCENYIKQIDSIIKSIKSIDNSKFEIKDKDKVEVIIIKKYIELQSKKPVIQYINELGHRVKTNSEKGERKYTHEDINAILESDKVIGDKQVQEVAKQISLLKSEIFYDNYFKRE